MSAELAYRFFLAVFPFAIMLAALSGFAADVFGLDNPTKQIVDQFSDRLPQDTASVLQRQIDEVVSSRSLSLISFGLIGALWAASGGMGALIKALNRAYDVPETRPFWRKTLLAIGLTLSAGLALVAAVIVMVAAAAWGEEIAGWFGAGDAFRWMVSIARWPIAVALIMTSLAVIYYVAPNIEQRFTLVSPGAVLCTVVWLAGTYAFGIYVAHFSSYNATYGALGGIVVLLLWFYLSAAMVLVGAELNALIDSQVDPEAVEDRRRKVIEQRATAKPTPQEEMEQRNHGKEPLQGRPPSQERERGNGLAGPVFTALGVLAAMFALRRLAR
jgi:membrane protein